MSFRYNPLQPFTNLIYQGTFNINYVSVKRERLAAVKNVGQNKENKIHLENLSFIVDTFYIRQHDLHRFLK